LQEFAEESVSDATSLAKIGEALESLNLESKDDGTVALIGRSGGVQTLLDTVHSLQKEREMLSEALQALASILSGEHT
jgi:ABC-type nitrate/sulfonate/bicarbonate transport system ATPase subunit